MIRLTSSGLDEVVRIPARSGVVDHLGSRSSGEVHVKLTRTRYSWIGRGSFWGWYVAIYRKLINQPLDGKRQKLAEVARLED